MNERYLDIPTFLREQGRPAPSLDYIETIATRIWSAIRHADPNATVEPNGIRCRTNALSIAKQIDPEAFAQSRILSDTQRDHMQQFLRAQELLIASKLMGPTP